MNTLRLSLSRLSALLRIGMLAVALSLPHAGAWAQRGPLTTSPTVPTPFSWSTFHSGGTSPTTLTTPPSFLPPNPLASQLQGTPTGLFGTSLTEIPSFLIGNYDFTQPPAGVTAGNITFFPNHFADDLSPLGTRYLSWSAPFTFLAATGQTTRGVPSQGHSSIVADDSQTTATTYQVYVPGATPTPASGLDAGWVVQWATSVTGTTANTWGAKITDVTASGDPSLPNNGTNTTTNPPTIGQEYRRQPAVSAPLGTKSASAAGYQTATWTFTAPATFSPPASAGLYSVVFHLPDPQVKTLADGTANPNYPEHRIGDPHYVITLLHAGATTTVFDTDTLNANGTIASRTAISQTETNDPQPLAGPFALGAGDVLTVTLDNTITAATVASTYVLADSVSLVPTASAGGSARVDGSPTAINVSDFPEIADALYFGRTNTGAADNTQPFGNATIGTANATTPGIQHNIRQLVYFGRTEGIVLTDNAGNLVDFNGAAVTTPVTRTVGAIYCVDGITGYVVWRFQTSDVLRPNGTILKPSAPVYTTPAIARLNVRVNGVVETKLCVVAADDNGLVYCLDAIGNRNGTDNSTAVDGTYNQPIYSPDAALVTGSTQDAAPKPHVGNTTAYWVYRPDASRPRLLGNNATPPATKAIDRTSDLPVPVAFGLASPTLYVNPNTAVDTATIAPGAAARATSLTPNGIVYIGNSNGTLYKLDATGETVTETATGSGIFYSPTETYNYVLPIKLYGLNPSTTAPLPTPSVGWWFAVNKGATNDTTQTGNVAITSAPSIYQPGFANAGVGANAEPQHLIYFGTSNETTNVGNVFSVLDTGPVTYSAAGASTGLTVGGTNYNLLARPNWSFPNAYTNTKTGTAIIHAALGSITGSPVVFSNPDDSTTRVYFAANQGAEGYQSERPAPAANGRIWAVDATLGTTQWAYPDTVDPNKDNLTGAQTTIGGTTVTQTQIDALPTLGTFRNASPAIGIVQFPAVIGYGTAGTTAYVHTDAVNTTNIVSARVPMLYIGSRTEAPDSSNFYSLDLDGRNDDERNVHYFNSATAPVPVGSTYGAGFESSPLLVTNPGPSTGAGGGNGGVVFIAATDNTLNELSATPTTDIGANSTGPMYTNFAQIGGFGAFASPAIAGYDTSNLQAPGAVKFDTDWVYGGDSTLGIARGITPGDRNGSGGTVDYGTGGPPPDPLGPPTVPQQLPLHVYLFDNTGTHDPKSTNMGLANGIGGVGSLAAFEWGDKLYIRISNVVPPNPPTTAKPLGDATLYMADPADKTVYYTNGGPIQVQLSDIDDKGKIVVGRGADAATVNTNTLANLTDPNGNGFIKESPSGSGAQDNVGDMLTDNLGTGGMWLGATTYAIGNGSNRKNTPGSRRQIISATQTVEAHNAVDNTFLQIVTLKVDVNSSPNSFRQRVPDPNDPTKTIPVIKRLPPVDQPTFAVLNPLAVRGGGPSIPLGNGIAVKQIDNIVGPFSGIDTANPQPDDLLAYVNGNNGYVATGASGTPVTSTDLPSSGVLSGDKRRRFRPVTTATTDIPHGSIGSNGNPNSTYAFPGQSDRTASPLNSDTPFGNYAFDVADRSAVGLNGDQISSLTVQTAPAAWNDNTGSRTGPGAVVNPLPWDDAPTADRAGSNSSTDYPNIGKQRLDQTLYNNNGTSGASVSDNSATLDPSPSVAGTTPANRKVQPDNVKIEVRVPKYQPANLQLYDQTTASGGRIPPSGLTSSAQTVYPMGYVARETVYVDSNHNHQRDDGEAYRTFRVITGVPVDMTMTVAAPTLDLGKLPQTFGVQTDTFLPTVTTVKPLGPFMPFQSAAMAAVVGAGYQNYFKPIVAHNEGNINLLNVHFDQKLLKYPSATASALPPSALPFGSDSLDAQATLNAFDLNGVTGPSANTDPRKYILRTSLDSDLAAYNRNPYLVAQNGAAYPGATFHKARISDTAGPILTVPDVPHDNVGPYSLLVGSALAQPTFGPPALDQTTSRPTSYGPPYIGLAVPLGTPVGAYAQDVRLFEGIDPYAKPATPGAPGYPDIQANGNYFYKPLFPPVYGGTVLGGSTTPGATDDMLTTVGSVVTQPYSNPIRVRASVVETRVTDGLTYGNLPQFDIPGSNGANGVADFLPVAFRNTFWSGGKVTAGDNGLSLYWTSARNATAAAPYQLVARHVPFTVAGGKGYFQADTADTANPQNQHWYDPITLAAPATNSVNTAISIAPDQHLLDVGNGNFKSDGTAYAFVQNVVAGSSTTVYQNNLYCYQIDPATGNTTGSAVSVSTDTRQPKFGARGLKFSTTFTDPLPAPPTGPARPTISNNLWAFWNGGARGRSTMFYSAATTGADGAIGTFSLAGALPLPAGLSGASDPSALLTQTTLANGTTVPAIDITYSGTNADGNTDVYVSRYQPYKVRKADRTYATDANGNDVIGLALTPSPALTEQLLPDTAHQFYQARDVAWARADTLDVLVGSGATLVHLLQDTSKTKNADGSYPLYAGIRTSYDRASGTAVYTNIPNDTASGRNLFTVNGGKVTVTTVYADLVRGRVRLGTSYTGTGAGTTTFTRVGVPLPDGLPIAATFQPQARRITTDRRADAEAVSFIDEAYKNNEANFYNVGLRAQGQTPTNTDVPRVSAARYWFLWRKSAAPGTTTTPTLYTKTQRLTVYLHGPSNNPVPIQLNTNNQPIVVVKDNTSGTTLYDSAALANAQVDVDWARGRLYFPLRDSSGHALEGDSVTVNFTYHDGSANGKTVPPITDNIHWLDELRYNDPAAQPTAGDPATMVDTNEHAVPIDVAANEGSPSAFLDPMAYADVVAGAYDPYNSARTPGLTSTDPADQPHKVWLFWNSTRSGTADVYYETIDPRFSANP